MNRRQFLTGLLATSAIVAVPAPIAEAVTNTMPVPALDAEQIISIVSNSQWKDLQLELIRDASLFGRSAMKAHYARGVMGAYDGIDFVDVTTDRVRIIDDVVPIRPEWFAADPLNRDEVHFDIIPPGEWVHPDLKAVWIDADGKIHEVF